MSENRVAHSRNWWTHLGGFNVRETLAFATFRGLEKHLDGAVPAGFVRPCTPTGGAPPTLWKPSGSPPPLLRITPPSPPFLAVLSLGMSLRGWRYAGFLFFLFGVTPASGSPVTDTRGTLDEYFAMREIVETSNACELPGVSIKYGPFLDCMWRAVERGFVDRDKASFVAEGLKSGFMAGVDVSKLRGHRWFRNYPPALEARRAVTKANNKRVGAFKTLALGVWSASLGSLVRATFGATAIAPLNAVPKPMEKDEVRPCYAPLAYDHLYGNISRRCPPELPFGHSDGNAI